MMNPEKITAVLEEVLNKGEEPVSLHEPLFGGREREYVTDCLDTGCVSSVGGYVGRFERELTRFTGVKYATAVASGTAALHLCLRLAGVGQGDEVLVPALTFVATPNAVCYCGAVPHFIDSDFKTLGADAEKLEAYLERMAVVKDGVCFNRNTMRPIRALVVMHTFGHPADLDRLLEVCREYRLELIEDAAESLGSYYKGIHTGNFGKLAALSFNGNKIVTTGGGGAVLTNDEALYRYAKHIAATAKLPHRWAFLHDEVGYNYRMPNLNAALGCAQMEQLEKFLCCKRALAEVYRQAFDGIQGVRFFTEPDYARSNYWLNVLLLDEENEELRDILLAETNDRGILTRPAWTLMSRLPMFRDCPQMDLSAAESLERRIINIPSSARLGAPFCTEGGRGDL